MRVRNSAAWTISLLLIIMIMVTWPCSVVAAADREIYRGVDRNGTLVFSDQQKTSAKSVAVNKKTPASTRPKWAVDRTAQGVVASKFKEIPSLLEFAINSYCSYDLKNLKRITLSPYWPLAETEITYLNSSDNDGGRSYLKNYCFSWFQILRIKENSGRMRGAGDGERPLAEVLVRAAQAGGRDEGYGYYVTFVKEQGAWKYYNVVSGPFGILPSDL